MVALNVEEAKIKEGCKSDEEDQEENEECLTPKAKSVKPKIEVDQHQTNVCAGDKPNRNNEEIDSTKKIA